MDDDKTRIVVTVEMDPVDEDVMSEVLKRVTEMLNEVMADGDITVRDVTGN